MPAPLYTQLPIEDVELLHQTLRDTDTMMTAGIGGAGARYDNCNNPPPPSPRAPSRPFVCIALFHRGCLRAVGPPSVLGSACAELPRARACSCTPLSPGCALTPPLLHPPLALPTRSHHSHARRAREGPSLREDNPTVIMRLVDAVLAGIEGIDADIGAGIAEGTKEGADAAGRGAASRAPGDSGGSRSSSEVVEKSMETKGITECMEETKEVTSSTETKTTTADPTPTMLATTATTCGVASLDMNQIGLRLNVALELALRQGEMSLILRVTRALVAVGKRLASSAKGQTVLRDTHLAVGRALHYLRHLSVLRQRVPGSVNSPPLSPTSPAAMLPPEYHAMAFSAISVAQTSLKFGRGDGEGGGVVVVGGTRSATPESICASALAAAAPSGQDRVRLQISVRVPSADTAGGDSSKNDASSSYSSSSSSYGSSRSNSSRNGAAGGAGVHMSIGGEDVTPHLAPVSVVNVHAAAACLGRPDRKQESAPSARSTGRTSLESGSNPDFEVKVVAVEPGSGRIIDGGSFWFNAPTQALGGEAGTVAATAQAAASAMAQCIGQLTAFIDRLDRGTIVMLGGMCNLANASGASGKSGKDTSGGAAAAAPVEAAPDVATVAAMGAAATYQDGLLDLQELFKRRLGGPGLGAPLPVQATAAVPGTRPSPAAALAAQVRVGLGSANGPALLGGFALLGCVGAVPGSSLFRLAAPPTPSSSSSSSSSSSDRSREKHAAATVALDVPLSAEMSRREYSLAETNTSDRAETTTSDSTSDRPTVETVGGGVDNSVLIGQLRAEYERGPPERIRKEITMALDVLKTAPVEVKDQQMARELGIPDNVARAIDQLLKKSAEKTKGTRGGASVDLGHSGSGGGGGSGGMSGDVGVGDETLIAILGEGREQCQRELCRTNLLMTKEAPVALQHSLKPMSHLAAATPPAHSVDLLLDELRAAGVPYEPMYSPTETDGGEIPAARVVMLESEGEVFLLALLPFTKAEAGKARRTLDALSAFRCKKNRAKARLRRRRGRRRPQRGAGRRAAHVWGDAAAEEENDVEVVTAEEWFGPAVASTFDWRYYWDANRPCFSGDARGGMSAMSDDKQRLEAMWGHYDSLGKKAPLVYRRRYRLAVLIGASGSDIAGDFALSKALSDAPRSSNGREECPSAGMASDGAFLFTHDATWGMRKLAATGNLAGTVVTQNVEYRSGRSGEGGALACIGDRLFFLPTGPGGGIEGARRGREFRRRRDWMANVQGDAPPSGRRRSHNVVIRALGGAPRGVAGRARSLQCNGDGRTVLVRRGRRVVPPCAVPTVGRSVRRHASPCGRNHGHSAARAAGQPVLLPCGGAAGRDSLPVLEQPRWAPRGRVLHRCPLCCRGVGMGAAVAAATRQSNVPVCRG